MDSYFALANPHLMPEASEYATQSAVVHWLRNQRDPAFRAFFHVPNGGERVARVSARGRRWSPEATKLKQMGARAGVPDLLLPLSWPPGVMGDNQMGCGIAVEFKHERNTPTDEQHEWLLALAERGWLCCVAWHSEPAIAAIAGYVTGRGIDQPDWTFVRVGRAEKLVVSVSNKTMPPTVTFSKKIREIPVGLDW